MPAYPAILQNRFAAQIADLFRRVTKLESRTASIDSGMPLAALPAVIDPGYTSGNPRVFINGSATLSSPCPHVASYSPVAGESVLVIPMPQTAGKNAGSYIVVGRLDGLAPSIVRNSAGTFIYSAAPNPPPISVVQSVVRYVAGAASITVPLNQPTAQANCLVIVVTMANATTNATVLGVTVDVGADNLGALYSVGPGAGGNGATIAFWADPNCAPGLTSVAVTTQGGVGAAELAVTVLEVTGLATTIGGLVDQTAGNPAGGPSTSFSSGATAATRFANELWVGAAGSFQVGNTLTRPAAPWLDLPQAFPGAALTGYQVTAATGAATFAGTLLSSAGWSAAVIALNPATPGSLLVSVASAPGTDGNGNSWVAGASIGQGVVAASVLGNVGVLNGNPYLTGGDGSGWFTGGSIPGNGSLSVTSTPPAGAPYKYALQFAVNASGGAVIIENGQGFWFPIQPSTQYLVTGWFYTNKSSIQLGFDWWNSAGVYQSTTVNTNSITPNTWTQLTAVITSPASGSQLGSPHVDPGASSTTYCQAITCLPQVPGSLVQAGTITATQIAAGSITAVLLAANIVKAGIVDATTITGAKIVADGASGQFLIYSGPPAAGNLIASLSGASGADTFANAYPKGLALTSSTLGKLSLEFDAGGVPSLFLATNNVNEGNPAKVQIAGSGTTGYFETLFLIGPTVAAFLNNYSALEMWSEAKDGSFSPGGSIAVHTGASTALMAQWGTPGGMSIFGNITATVPGAVTQTAETWHAVSLPTGWTGTARVKVLAETNLAIFDFSISGGTTTALTFGSFPNANYYPNTSRVYAPGFTGANSSTTNPRVIIPVNGAITLSGLPATVPGQVSGTFVFPLD